MFRFAFSGRIWLALFLGYTLHGVDIISGRGIITSARYLFDVYVRRKIELDVLLI